MQVNITADQLSNLVREYAKRVLPINYGEVNSSINFFKDLKGDMRATVVFKALNLEKRPR